MRRILAAAFAVAAVLAACRGFVSGDACAGPADCPLGSTCAAGTCVVGTAADGGAGRAVDGGDVDAGEGQDGGGLDDDGGALDDGGGLVDGGGQHDGGPPVDGGGLDDDGGGLAVDGGSLVDGGALDDGGGLDGGGPPQDAGVVDVVDGGAPPGVDAGFPRSCREARDADPAAPTGPFSIEVEDGDGGVVVTTLYCEMDRAGGGWTRLASFVAADEETCPGALVRTVVGAFVGCARQQAGGGARSVLFTSPVPYTDVLGRVLAVAYGSNDAYARGAVTTPTIDGTYVDGVSITRGSPRAHVWSLAACVDDDELQGDSECPCTGGTSAPAFVGVNATCDCPSSAIVDGTRSWDDDEPLFDDGAESCPLESAPWFVRTGLPAASSALELRAMGNQGQADEDVAVVELELYVR